MASPPSHGLILLAEDEVMVRNLIRTILQKEGYDVLAAADGNEALELSRAHRETIDLFLTDVEMPHLDGLSAYRQISSERSDLKVLFLSGGSLSQLNLPGPWPFLKEPFEANILLARLKKILKGQPPITDKGLKVILVVDQQPDRRERTKNILTENGYAVLTATSAEEAEALSDSVAQIDLIVSEVVFTGNSGVHLAEHVEASERNISTLLISHFHRDILCDLSGFSRQPEFLPNPFSPEALLTHVRRLLEG